MKTKQAKTDPADLARIFDPTEIDDLIADLHNLGEQAKAYPGKKKPRKKVKR
jgi:hypothetical protein